MLLLQEETYVALRQREDFRRKNGLTVQTTSAARARAFDSLAHLFRDLCGEEIVEIDEAPYFNIKHA